MKEIGSSKFMGASTRLRAWAGRQWKKAVGAKERSKGRLENLVLTPPLLSAPGVGPIAVPGVVFMTGDGGGSNSVAAQVEGFPHRIRAEDLSRQPAEHLGPLAEVFAGKKVHDLTEFHAAIASMARLSERSGRVSALLGSVQSKLPQISEEKALFSYLAQAIARAGFERVLVYKRYIGEILEGKLHCVSGAGIDPRTSTHDPKKPATEPNPQGLWAITIREAADQFRPVLLQRVDNPAIDPRCNPDKIAHGDARYKDPHVAVPLIDSQRNVRGFIAVWVERGETEKFDPNTCISFITLAGMVARRLCEIDLNSPA